jgi:pre-mRNA-splicing helicase BRR2
MDVSALNLGVIAAFYNISCLFVSYETIPIRRHEDTLLRRICDRVPVKLDRADFETPHFKTTPGPLFSSSAPT